MVRSGSGWPAGRVRVHNFKDQDLGKVNPCGDYNVAATPAG